MASSTTTTGGMDASSMWCLACSSLHRTSAGRDEPLATCPRCARAALEEIVEVMDAATFLRCCHPLTGPRLSTPDAAAAASSRLQLPAIKVSDSGRTCAVCLDDLEPGASAVVTPCDHVFHAGCVTPWLEANDTCPLCRAKSGLLPVQVQGDDGAAGAAAPDGLVLSEPLHDGRYRLGRCAAGRVFNVRILDREGKLVRGGVMSRMGDACRRLSAVAGNLLRSRDRVIDFDLLVIT